MRSISQINLDSVENDSYYCKKNVANNILSKHLKCLNSCAFQLISINKCVCQQFNAIKSTQWHLKKKVETKLFNIESKHWIRAANSEPTTCSKFSSATALATSTTTATTSNSCRLSAVPVQHPTVNELCRLAAVCHEIRHSIAMLPTHTHFLHCSTVKFNNCNNKSNKINTKMLKVLYG